MFGCIRIIYLVLYILQSLTVINTAVHPKIKNRNDLHELQLLLGKDLENSQREIVVPTITSSDNYTSHLLAINPKNGTSFTLYLTASTPVVSDADFVYFTSNKINNETLSRCKQCFYEGIDIHRNAVASLTIFDGLRGIISEDEYSYYIHPVDKGVHWNNSTEIVSLVEVPHYFIRLNNKNFKYPELLKKRAKRSSRIGRYYQQKPYHQYPYYTNSHYLNTKPVKKLKDENELLSSYHIETAVFVDQKLHERYLQEYGRSNSDKLDIFLFSLISNVDHLMSHSSLGGVLKIVLVHIEVFEEQPSDLDPMDGDIDGYLKNFCEWQERRMNNQPFGHLGHKLHWDHAILLTGIDLHRKDSVTGRKNSSYVGYAYVNGMCNSKYSCTINEGTSFRGVFVTAHEMGHSMGMTHDGEDHNSCDAFSYLMSASLHPRIGKPKISWSTCSRSQLHEFLKSSRSKCLKNVAIPPHKNKLKANGKLPGDHFTADQQCRVLCGKNCQAYTSQKPDEICEALICERDKEIRTAHQALEGTKCDEGKKCQEGACREWMERKIQIVRPTVATTSVESSYWLEWNAYSPCTSKCILAKNKRTRNPVTWGVVQEVRQCSWNFNSGACKGPTHRLRLCDHTKFCNSQRKIINVNEFANGVCNNEHSLRSNIFLPTSVGYNEIYTNGDVDMTSKSCMIWCKRRHGGYISSSSYLPDGTPCDVVLPGKKAFCVKGVCVQFGCDGVQLEFSDPSSCREAVQWPNNHFNDISNALSSDTNRNNIVIEDQCYGCLYQSLVIEASESCNGWSSCQTKLNYRKRRCDCRKSPDDFASEQCSRIRSKYQNLLSGYGKVLKSTSGDHNLPCFVCCENKFERDLYYKMENPLTLMPDGTNCSVGDGVEKYCYKGECLPSASSRSKRSTENGNNFKQDSKIMNQGNDTLKDYNKIVTLKPQIVTTILNVSPNSREPEIELLIQETKNSYLKSGFGWQIHISDCSIYGERKIRVTCISKHSYNFVSEVYCQHLPRPDINRSESCQHIPRVKTENFKKSNKSEWKLGIWDVCNKQNGNPCRGQQYRSVSCTMNIGHENVVALVGDEYCGYNKPNSYQECVPKECKNSSEGSSKSRKQYKETQRYINSKDLLEWIKKNSFAINY